jgi:hypothetical protein
VLLSTPLSCSLLSSLYAVLVMQAALDLASISVNLLTKSALTSSLVSKDTFLSCWITRFSGADFGKQAHRLTDG